VLGARRVRRAAGADVAVFRTADDRVFALLDRCPHKGGPLSQGLVFGEHVACPLHNWAISLVDGQARAPDVGCATRFAVRVDADDVSLLASELAGLAVDGGALAGVDPATSRRMTEAPSSCAQSQDPPLPRTIPIVAA
jgi:nitrite reductase (NADH) small subunit